MKKTTGKLHQMLLQLDNALSHCANMKKAAIQELALEENPHSLYSSDFVPSDFHLFHSPSSNLYEKSFNNENALQTLLDDFFNSKLAVFFKRGAALADVVLYGYETWTITLEEEQMSRLFENKVIKKIFEAKKDEVAGEWRKSHNVEVHILYSSTDIIRNIKSRRFRWGGRKAPLGRPRRRCDDIIKMDLRVLEYDVSNFRVKRGTATSFFLEIDRQIKMRSPPSATIQENNTENNRRTRTRRIQGEREGKENERKRRRYKGRQGEQEEHKE
ncbi:hypothetical protein ANN_15309 [Periplaneta americana]|uniref:Uncharacterized protein n=1 Tax=Periplaneta americana TaxID=6978 RepID=A0ABQ8SH46_PERAM|nr:hypothetical protein ANN_15309 [Periplaneta americana]